MSGDRKDADGDQASGSALAIVRGACSTGCPGRSSTEARGSGSRRRSASRSRSQSMCSIDRRSDPAVPAGGVSPRSDDAVRPSRRIRSSSARRGLVLEREEDGMSTAKKRKTMQRGVSAGDAALDLDARTGSRVVSARWSSTTARRRRRRRSCSTTTSTSCTGSRRSSAPTRARRWPRSGGGSCSIGVEDNDDPAVLGADGLGVAVPDRQLRHGLLPQLHRPARRADGDRRAHRSARRRGSSARSTTCGSAGSPTSACPGPDRAQGGRYLIVGPGHDGPLPDGGFHVSHARTTRVVVLGRAFMVDDDPGPPVEAIRDGVRISPYVPGGQGTAVAAFLAGEVPTLAPGRPGRRDSGSSRGRGSRSTRSRRTTSASGRPSTSWCSRSRPGRVSPS